MNAFKFINAPKRGGYSPVITDVFESIFNEAINPSRYAAKVPAVNISESGDHFAVALAAPGLKKEDFKISLNENVLTISSDKKEEVLQEGTSFNRREYNYATFSRSFTLPETADHGHIDAEYTDGILKVTIGKKEEAKPVAKEIVIK